MQLDTKGKAALATDQHHDVVRDCFDNSAERWYDIYTKVEKANDFIQIERKNLAKDFLQKYTRTNALVLDAGCGTGVVALEILDMGYRVYGIDIADSMIQRAKELRAMAGIHKEKWELATSELKEAHFEDESFEAILALGFLEYQTDEVAVLREMNRILKPGGCLVISGPRRFTLQNYFRLGLVAKEIFLLIKRLTGRKVETFPEASINEYSTRRFRKLLAQANFKILDVCSHGYANFMFVPQLFGEQADFALYKFFSKVSRRLPISPFANNITLVAKKSET